MRCPGQYGRVVGGIMAGQGLAGREGRYQPLHTVYREDEAGGVLADLVRGPVYRSATFVAPPPVALQQQNVPRSRLQQGALRPDGTVIPTRLRRHQQPRSVHGCIGGVKGAGPSVGHQQPRRDFVGVQPGTEGGGDVLQLDHHTAATSDLRELPGKMSDIPAQGLLHPLIRHAIQ
eukprot:CAMPEP_0117652334 /NCGR_PEP_ID=MMETSP0804-20121206/2570_1 /TAXON_ID=1074897 /ORGANISM="Tetraselmis astigmatica, Strain CCMP880" /LENGTH=174 /DNA_ID=CAMNT_0005458371 /DNA_START=163 /DNA_END=687 /DNA_ORIENTATION=+